MLPVFCWAVVGCAPEESEKNFQNQAPTNSPQPYPQPKDLKKMKALPKATPEDYSKDFFTSEEQKRSENLTRPAVPWVECLKDAKNGLNPKDSMACQDLYKPQPEAENDSENNNYPTLPTLPPLPQNCEFREIQSTNGDQTRIFIEGEKCPEFEYSENESDNQRVEKFDFKFDGYGYGFEFVTVLLPDGTRKSSLKLKASALGFSSIEAEISLSMIPIGEVKNGIPDEYQLEVTAQLKLEWEFLGAKDSKTFSASIYYSLDTRSMKESLEVFVVNGKQYLEEQVPELLKNIWNDKDATEYEEAPYESDDRRSSFAI